MATVSGKWKWNEKVQPSGPWQQVNFTSNGMVFTRFSISWGGVGYDITYEDESENIVYVGGIMGTNDTIEGVPFHSDEYRLIDFGKTEQEVSEIFYNYLIANAKPYPEVAYIKGKWKWHDPIVTSITDLDVSVNFVSASERCDRIRIYVNENNKYLSYYHIGTGLEKYVSARAGMGLEISTYALHIMDFGDEEQIVPIEFYELLIQNAEQLPDNTIAEPTRNYVISGTELVQIGEALRSIGFSKHLSLSQLPKYLAALGRPQSGDLITFTIGNTEYQAREGMTWEEWCYSIYNTDEFYIGGQHVVLPYNDTYLVWGEGNSGTQVVGREIIEANHTYSMGLE